MLKDVLIPISTTALFTCGGFLAYHFIKKSNPQPDYPLARANVIAVFAWIVIVLSIVYIGYYCHNDIIKIVKEITHQTDQYMTEPSENHIPSPMQTPQSTVFRAGEKQEDKKTSEPEAEEDSSAERYAEDSTDSPDELYETEVPVALLSSAPKTQDRVTVSYFPDQTILTLDLNEYLIGVVSSALTGVVEYADVEISELLEQPEFLKVLCVVYRTYSKEILERNPVGCHPSQHEGICTSNNNYITRDQIHNNTLLTSEEKSSNWNANSDRIIDAIIRAITDTDDEVVIYDNKYIEAFQHLSSGGHYTSDGAKIYDKRLPYCVPVQAEDGDYKLETEIEIPISQFITSINNKNSKIMLTVSDLVGFSYNNIDHPQHLRNIVIGKKEIPIKIIRDAFGVRTNIVILESSKSDVRIRTFGMGNGVGLSQMGAFAMSKSGASYKDIIEHFYTGVSFSHIGGF